MTWTGGLDEFLTRFDAYAAEHLTEHHRHGCRDLPHQNLALGPRYSVRGFDIPLSVFRGEGVILWSLVREFEARRIVETYTGTGVAAVFLGSASTTGTVWTCDHYGEGGMGDAGWEHALKMVGALSDIDTIECVRGSVPDLLAQHRQWLSLVGGDVRWDLQFADGCHPPAFEARVTIHHDEAGYVPHSFPVPGTSLMVVQAPDLDDFRRAQTAVDRALAWCEEHPA